MECQVCEHEQPKMKLSVKGIVNGEVVSKAYQVCSWECVEILQAEAEFLGPVGLST